MQKKTRLTLEELLKNKEELIKRKSKKQTKDLYIKSLNATITIQGMDDGMAKDIADMEDGDEYVVYNCVVSPNLKDKALQKEYGCVEPMEIVSQIFMDGEINSISLECAKLSGFVDGVKAIGETKNS